MPQIIEHLEEIVGGLDSPPILIGHSAGGVFTQILLDHGFGAAGVAINSAPTEGVPGHPAVPGPRDVPGPQEPGQPAPRRRLHARAVALRVHEHVHRGGVAGALRAVPHPRLGRDLLGQRAGQHPPGQGRQLGRLQERRARAAAVHLGQRGPPDAAQDPAVQRQALQVGHDHRGQGVRGPAPAARPRPAGRRSPTTRSSGRWRTPASERRVNGVRITHIGGPTVLIEVAGWRLLTDPTFDPPGRSYRFGWGTSSRKLTGPAIAAGRPRSDRRGPAHPRPPRATTSTTPAARCSRRPAPW